MISNLTEEQIRDSADNPNYRGYEELMLAIALLQLDELKAIRKATENIAGGMNHEGTLMCVEVCS